jgi:hypothetical protein
VRRLDTLVVGTEPVSVDAYAATLFDLTWRDLGYLRKAVDMGLRSLDPDRVPVVVL